MTFQLSFVDDTNDERTIAFPRLEPRKKKQPLPVSYTHLTLPTTPYV